MNNLIDVHTHILHNIDDGAEDITESSRLFDGMRSQNVTTVVATPHFYPFEMKLDDFLAKRENSFLELKNAGVIGNINLLSGCEALITPNFEIYEDIEPLKIQSTRLLMLEIPYFSDMSTEKAINIIEKMMSVHNFTPVIAHIDRYDFFKFRRADIIEELIDMGCRLQINTNAFLVKSEYKFALKLMQAGYIHFIGSDCHGMKWRLPNMKDAYDVIEKHLGSNMAAALNERAGKLLKLMGY